MALALALNAADLPAGLALNFELTADAAGVPAEVMLIPAGATIQGRDGRTWRNPNPQGVVDFFALNRSDIPFDVEHSTHHKAPNGDPAPAAGWVKGLNVRADGSVWGAVEWTPRGLELVRNREYRYYSPVFLYETETLIIRGIASVGLTNKPNLDVLALNREEKEFDMKFPKQLLDLLGLPEDATTEQVVAACQKMKADHATALNAAQTPSLEKFVPRGDYDAVLARATNAEQSLATQKKAELETAINAEVDAAVKAGKVTPATKDFYVGMCRQADGLEQFKKFAAAAPVIGAPSDLDTKKSPGSDTALNAEQKTIADMFGNSAEDLKKYGQA
jgi:phage I-like protein